MLWGQVGQERWFAGDFRRITAVYCRKRGCFKLTLSYVSLNLSSLRFISVNANENLAGSKYRLMGGFKYYSSAFGDRADLQSPFCDDALVP